MSGATAATRDASAPSSCGSRRCRRSAAQSQPPQARPKRRFRRTSPPSVPRRPPGGGRRRRSSSLPSRRRKLTPDFEPDTALPPLSVRNPLVWLASRILVRLAGMRTGQMPVTTPPVPRRNGRGDRRLQGRHRRYRLRRRNRRSRHLRRRRHGRRRDAEHPAGPGFRGARRSMVVQTFNENIGGDRFWATVDELLRRPSGRDELIELFHACVAAGFLGKYRLTGRQDRGLSDRMAAMHAELARTIPKTGEPLVPHWKGVVARSSGSAVGPLLAFAALCACLLLGPTPLSLLAPTAPPISAAVWRSFTIRPRRWSSSATRRRRKGAAAGRHLLAAPAHPLGARRRDHGGHRRGRADRPAHPHHHLHRRPVRWARPAQPRPCAVHRGDREIARSGSLPHPDRRPHRRRQTVEHAEIPDNQALSEARGRLRRARTLKGLKDGSRIDTEGRGANEPLVKGDRRHRQGPEPAHRNLRAAARRRVGDHDLSDRKPSSGRFAIGSAAVILIGVLIWYAGPLLELAGYAPLESEWIRLCADRRGGPRLRAGDAGLVAACPLPQRRPAGRPHLRRAGREGRPRFSRAASPTRSRLCAGWGQVPQIRLSLRPPLVHDHRPPGPARRPRSSIPASSS